MKLSQYKIIIIKIIVATLQCNLWGKATKRFHVFYNLARMQILIII